MSALLLGVLGTSLVGSLHCAGMCGPFVAVYSGLDGRGRSGWGSHAAYHLGRFVTYVTLGALAGGLGSAVDLAGSAAGLARVSAIAAGFAMMLLGLSSLLETQGLRLPSLGPAAAPGRALRRVLGKLDGKPGPVRALVIGLATTLLPCGWLYAFVITAAGAGSVSGGAGVMAAFWLGSVPLLLAAGVGVRALSARLRQHVPVLTSALLVGIGLFTVVSRVNAPGLALETLLKPGSAGESCPHHAH